MIRAPKQPGLAPEAGVAEFPSDGTSPQALVSGACDWVRGERP